MRNEVYRVGCEACGWRGRRIYDDDADCGHDYPCSCSPFGACPKCGRWVNSMASIKRRRQEFREWCRENSANG